MQIKIEVGVDWHLHLRRGLMASAVLPYSARQFAGAIVMPNPEMDECGRPVYKRSYLKQYQAELEAIAPEDFRLLMGLYASKKTDPGDVAACYEDGLIRFVKFYPGSTRSGKEMTTGSRHALHWSEMGPILEITSRLGIPNSIHMEIDEWDGRWLDHPDRERVYIKEILPRLQDTYPNAIFIIEHASTKEAVEALLADKTGRLGITLTPPHILFTRAELERRGDYVSPHFLCMPILKDESDREAIWELLRIGHPNVFPGTDSAPHPASQKVPNIHCCKYGCFSAATALELYAMGFSMAGTLHTLEKFLCNGFAFYGIEPFTKTVCLEEHSWFGPGPIKLGDTGETVVPIGWHDDPAKCLELTWKMVGS